MEIDLGVICASAPVLKPLLAKIPFSLSGTFSGGISLKKKITTNTSSGYNSKTSKQSFKTLDDLRSTPSTITFSSKRKSEAIRAAPDLDKDQGRSYELRNWDEERAISIPEPLGQTERSLSQDAILREQRAEETARAEGGFQKMWHKITSRGSESSNEDMTITMTSEVELSNEPASAYNSKRTSRHKDALKQHRALKDHKSPPPQPNDRQWI